jgi:hypothetical protein
MARAGAWALLLGALGCSELKAGNWMPDAATMADGGTAVDAGAMTLDAGAMTLDAGAMVADAAALVDSGPPCPRDRLRCGDRCVDPRGDRMNCGACGVQCAECRDGRCR